MEEDTEPVGGEAVQAVGEGDTVALGGGKESACRDQTCCNYGKSLSLRLLLQEIFVETTSKHKGYKAV